jgi:TPR repeat protein
MLPFSPFRYRRSSEQGYVPALFALSQSILNAPAHAGVSSEEAACENFKLLQLTVKNDPNMDHAFFLLGLCYLHGDGVSACAEEATKNLLKAAELHHPAAQSMLGVCYYNGLGVERDVSRAFHWLRLAAAQGDEAAESKLEEILGTAEIDRGDVLGSSLRHFAAIRCEDLAQCVVFCTAALQPLHFL